MFGFYLENEFYERISSETYLTLHNVRRGQQFTIHNVVDAIRSPGANSQSII